MKSQIKIQLFLVFCCIASFATNALTQNSDFPEQKVNIHLEITSGKLPFEISWRITTINDEIILGGGAPYSNNIELNYGVYKFIALDAFDDGWNGATYTITRGETIIANNEGRSPEGSRQTEIFVITPPVEIGISRAVSVNIDTVAGYKYQMYRSFDQETWGPVGEPFVGDGTVHSFFQHVSNSGSVFYKAEIVDIIGNINPPGSLSFPDFGLDMAKIPSGAFVMGSALNESLRDPDEGPQTVVTITKDYWIGTKEITQEQFQAIMNFNPSRFAGISNPVETVSWDEAVEFCQRLTTRYAGQNLIPSGYKFGLPTEAQWEKAARAGTTSMYHFGTDASLLRDHAWYISNSLNRTQPVGLKQPSPNGLFDIYGNVLEWCQDNWRSQHPGGEVEDPLYFTGSSGNRVIRGGGYEDGINGCRSAYRKYRSGGGRYDFIGFRVAIVPVEQ